MGEQARVVHRAYAAKLGCRKSTRRQGRCCCICCLQCLRWWLCAQLPRLCLLQYMCVRWFFKCGLCLCCWKAVKPKKKAARPLQVFSPKSAGTGTSGKSFPRGADGKEAHVEPRSREVSEYDLRPAAMVDLEAGLDDAGLTADTSPALLP